MVDGSDASGLAPEMQEVLEKKKRLLRHENEAYLREHPELKLVMQRFFSQVLNDKPKDKLEQVAAEFFTNEANYSDENRT